MAGWSILTMLGIIIGITSVIMIISIGDGVKGQVNDELNAMAGGLIGIYVNNEHSEDEACGYFESSSLCVASSLLFLSLIHISYRFILVSFGIFAHEKSSIYEVCKSYWRL